MPRTITYREAISEAFVQAFEQDPTLFMMGCGITDPKGTFGTTLEITKRFGSPRVFDVPLSENGITGFAIGAAIAGMHPVVVHQRNDFLLLTMDQIVNHAAKWKYMAGGRLSVPLVIRSIVGRGWGQAAQHSQNLHAMFAHVPGLKVVMPSDAHDAKGLMMTSLAEKSTVIFIEHRWLHEMSGEVPAEPYRIPLGQAAIKKAGGDITFVAISHMVPEGLKAAALLEKDGISAEVCDLRTLSPIDWETVFASVRKTGRLVVADTGWRSFGASAEISAQVYETLGSALKAPIRRVTLPDGPTPCSAALEKIYYPDADVLAKAAKELMAAGSKAPKAFTEPSEYSSAPRKEFLGPF
ncbi:MAG: alpha-ketoacid dehydrogenase subunit beta [Candidatus Omnitrophica bacterium]|nr:alpha-ketoacid dehydrogenase subunit beta [Candidatus Omnitrophota bacterium]